MVAVHDYLAFFILFTGRLRLNSVPRNLDQATTLLTYKWKVLDNNLGQYTVYTN
jgi:hypothetical protein